MANNSVGQVQLDLILNSAAFKKQMNNAVNSAVSSSMKSQSSAVTKGFMKLGKLAAAAFSVKVISDFTKQSIELGSNLAEVQNVVDSTFTTLNEDINEFAKNAIKNFGLSELSAKKYAGTMGAMAKSFGFTEEEAATMAKTLTGLTGDVSSFYNLTSDEAYTKMKAVFSGETESLKDLGVVMTQAALDEFALAKGMGKTTAAMSEKEKVALRYAFVQDKLQTATGDFIRTQDSWANQTRMLSLQLDSMKANIGQGLISMLTPVIKVINQLVASLVTASAAFKNFMEDVFGVQQTAQSGAGSLTGATDAAGEMAGGLDNAAGSAKKLKKALMGFDNLNVLPDNSSAASGGSGGSIAAMPSLDAGGTGEAGAGGIGKIKAIVDELIAKFKELAAIVKDGFLTGLGSQNTKQIEANLKNIGSILANIVTDADVLDSAKAYVAAIIKHFGTVAGALSSVGITLGNFLTGSFSKALSARKDTIKADIIDVFNVGTEIVGMVSDFTTKVADIFSVFGRENATELGSSILKVVYDVSMGIQKLGARVSRDVFALITEPITKNTEEIKVALDGLLGNYATIWNAISNLVSENVNKMVQVYDTNLKPLIDSIKNGITEIVNTFLTQWNTYMQPVLSEIATKVAEIYEEHISPIVSKLIEIVGKIGDALRGLWENFLQPLVNVIVKTVVPLIAKALKNIWDNFSIAFAGIAGIIKGLLTTIGGIIDFIAGVFTGDWKRAWGGVKDIFKGTWDSLVSVMKTPINLIIGMINKMIDGVNNLDFTMPDWVPIVGGKSLGFTIPKIPLLAEGGYVAPNTPQLAVIGDNRHQGEIVAPENKLREAVATQVQPVLTAIQQLAAALVAQNANGGDIIIPVNIGGETIDTIIVNAQGRQALRSGGH